MKKLLLSLVLLLGISLTTRAQQSWDMDKVHSAVKFGVTHLVISTVEGNFKDFEGKLSTKPDGSIDKLEAHIKTTSVNTENDQRDKHLRSDDFFAADKFPDMVFISKSIKKTGNENYSISGDLTIRGVTKTVVLDAKYNGTIKDPWGNSRMGWTASTKINRFDFGLAWSQAIETGGLVVGKEVTITINAEFVAKVPKT
jgi:polyisoprenoid-binding protein YceI